MANNTQNWSANADLVVGNDLWLYLVDLGSAKEGTASAMTYGMATATTAALAYATSCSLEISADQLEAASKMSCRWNVARQGTGSYTINADALYCLQANAAANGCKTIDDLFEAMIAGDNVGWVIAQDAHTECNTIEGPKHGENDILYWGEAAITSLSITGGNNEIASSSISLAGSGAPHKGDDEA